MSKLEKVRMQKYHRNKNLGILTGVVQKMTKKLIWTLIFTKRIFQNNLSRLFSAYSLLLNILRNDDIPEINFQPPPVKKRCNSINSMNKIHFFLSNDYMN